MDGVNKTPNEASPKKPRKPKSKSQGSRNVRNGKNLELRYSKLWTQLTGIEFRRRRVEGHSKATCVVDGVADIICTSAKCKFVIECKKVMRFSSVATPLSPKAIFWDWWSQVCRDTQLLSHYHDYEVEYFPFLHFKYTAANDMVAFRQCDIAKLDLIRPIGGYTIIPSFDEKIIKNVELPDLKLEVTADTQGVQITTWGEFAQCVEPESLFFG